MGGALICGQLGALGAPAPRRPGAGARPTASTTIQILVRHTYVRSSASGRAPHIGVVERGARFATTGVVHGPGCTLGWYRLAGGGFVCAVEVAQTSKHPGAPRYPVVPRGLQLPFRYVAVAEGGSGEYLDPADAASDYFLRELAPRNAVSVAQRLKYDGEWFYKTTRGTYVPASEVYRIRAPGFSGQKLGGQWTLPVAFVRRNRTRVYARPGRASPARVKRFDRFSVLERRRRWGQRYYRIGVNRWLRARDVRLAERAALPTAVGAGQRWIDVDVGQQVLTAYEGGKPVFTTLVSTGLHAKTPLGSFRVWAKLAATDMRSQPRDAKQYQLWDVPWTVFFKGAIALHGTYWHRRFGTRKSAGCVNLSPRDARTVFGFVRPELPPGWWAVLPRKSGAGSVVRVRDGKRLGSPKPHHRKRRRETKSH
ncbi:MAG: L,D-transpeptidase [bacterium]